MWELFRHAGWVAWPLGGFSVLALAVTLERLFTLERLRGLEDRAFASLQVGLQVGGGDEHSTLRDPHIAGAPLTVVMQALVGTAHPGQRSEQAIDGAAEIGIALQRLRFRRNLSALATIGSTAPFIGLFGTVLGVMQAFHQMSRSGLSGESIAGGISEALSATALGLLVAIPSVIAYNILLSRVQSLLLHLQDHVARLLPLLSADGYASLSGNGAHRTDLPESRERLAAVGVDATSRGA